MMSLALFKQLGLNHLEPTSMQLLMANRMVKIPVGISFDVIVRVDNFIFPIYFVIMDCELDTEMPIVVRKPFISIGRVMVDM